MNSSRTWSGRFSIKYPFTFEQILSVAQQTCKARGLLLLGEVFLAVLHSGLDSVTTRFPASWAHCRKSKRNMLKYVEKQRVRNLEALARRQDLLNSKRNSLCIKCSLN